MNDPRELMHGLADGHLSPEEHQEAMRLLAEQPELQRELEWARTLKATLRNSCKNEAQDASWNKCVGRLDELDRSKRHTSFVTKYAWALCCALMLIIVAGGVANRAVGSKTLDSTQVASLLDPFSANSSDSRTAMRMAAPDLDAAKNLNLREYQVTSQASGLVDGRPFVRLGLRDSVGLGGLALVLIKDADRIAGLDQPTGHAGFTSGKLNNMNCVSWVVSGHTVVLLGERSTEELVQMGRGMLSR
jgi:hypothetical protein